MGKLMKGRVRPGGATRSLFKLSWGGCIAALRFKQELTSPFDERLGDLSLADKETC